MFAQKLIFKFPRTGPYALSSVLCINAFPFEAASVHKAPRKLDHFHSINKQSAYKELVIITKSSENMS